MTILRMLLAEAVRLTSLRNTVQPSAFRSYSNWLNSLLICGASVLSTSRIIFPRKSGEGTSIPLRMYPVPVDPLADRTTFYSSASPSCTDLSWYEVEDDEGVAICIQLVSDFNFRWMLIDDVLDMASQFSVILGGPLCTSALTSTAALWDELCGRTLRA